MVSVATWILIIILSNGQMQVIGSDYIFRGICEDAGRSLVSNIPGAAFRCIPAGNGIVLQ